MAPIVLEIERRKLDFRLIHTGQHHDYKMSKRFIEQLELPKPSASFELRATRPASQIGEMMTKLERALRADSCEMLLIQGDTNSMLAAALTGAKLGIKIAHVEAGLRSYDWRMPEEHNRRMVDHVSDILFAPTHLSSQNLLSELVHGEIFVTGNTAMDAIIRYMPLARKESRILSQIRFPEFALATLHRAENVDDPSVLKSCARAFMRSPIPVVFPAHPRTAKRISEFGIKRKFESADNIQLLGPQGYFDFIMLMKKCSMILTDSGGIQEEATSPLIRKPVLVLRRSTERPEAIERGFSRLVGLGWEGILAAIRQLLDDPPRLAQSSPYGDGMASKRIVRIVKRELS